MRQSGESPVPAERRSAFAALPYYPIDEGYRVPASLRQEPGDQIIQLSTSTGIPRRMRRVGTLAFTLKGQSLALTRLRGSYMSRWLYFRQAMMNWNRFLTACVIAGALLMKYGVPVTTILFGLAGAALVNWQMRPRHGIARSQP